MCLLCSRRDLEAKAGYSVSSPEGCVSDTEQSCFCGSNQEVYSPNFGLRESVKFQKDFGIWHKVAKVFFFFCSIHLSHVRLFATPWTAHTSLPCPSPTPEAYSNSCPSSWWCHPTISSSVVPFSSCLQSFPASGSFPVSQFFASDGQSIRSLTFNISLSVRGGTLTETAHPARHHSNHLHELFYNRRSWWRTWN